jgi:hypothetical protein
MAHRRKRNPYDPEHAYNEAVEMVANEFEETFKQVNKKLYKILGKDDAQLVKDAFQHGFDEFRDEWGL